MRILVTGGAGYIGSMVSISLLQAGHDVVILDDLSNSYQTSIQNIERITKKKCTFIKGSVMDLEVLQQLFTQHKVEGVIHLAGKKYVNESIHYPLDYYYANVVGTLQLVDTMLKHGVTRIVFSSSATIYGDAAISPVREDAARVAISPYGQTKIVSEHFLEELSKSNAQLSVVILRYFNPVGAHPSGLLGEQPKGQAPGLFPCIMQSVMGLQPMLQVYGSDYETKDGTCIRDYIHIEDLAAAHIQALHYTTTTTGCEAFNIGSGKGYTILEVLQAFEEVNHIAVPHMMHMRREGDIAISFANIEKSVQHLGWQPKKTLQDMCFDAWVWHQEAQHRAYA